MTIATLEVQNLQTEFASRAGTVRAVNNVSFSVQPGQIMGLVGESGSGKSMTAYSIMGLIEPPGKVAAGKVLFRGQDLRSLSAEAMRQIRGNRIAMIFQDPMMTLNPVLRIDTQMMETIFAHQQVSREKARDMARAALVKVGIPSPDERLLSYPHQFSGGMRQRVAIAIALLNEPELIICDEPTTALDVTMQGQILYEMQKLCRESGTALIWITHDLSVVAGLADTVAVMYAGKIVESGSVQQVLEQARHPYTHGLIASSPSRNLHGQSLRQIPGSTPSLLNLPQGCAFRLRCERASAVCEQEPVTENLQGHSVLCFHPMHAVTEVTHD
ncbi:ABC transporter ATP-binding protein [Undibacterium pigrum]|uniref:Peptide/nickel transport system ATP-binding protein n=1 Tax=Undibacterium pigrum TaxID=401470 RepID=A0A318JCE8_9BURK|nr:ABC transporter ATP-binding protein [Undibacterium pigrum]PXX45266.1 peptide/nickel transport system ATP-binding protein [Undibacterium pigrum]